MEIRTEMAGSLWKLFVNEGTSITKGQDIAILESMKMEIPVTAKTSGTVKKIKHIEGEFLNEGDIIAIIE